MISERPDSRLSEAPAAPFQGNDSTPPPRRRRWWPWVLGVAAALLLVYFLVPHGKQGEPEEKAGRGAGGKGGDGARAVPVLAATAKTKDVGVYLTGLGTVDALSTVTVRSRVDGQLMRVAFREGELVQKGSLLAEIDPRPFQVQLMQADGQKAKDEAALRNAQVDLKRYETLVQSDSIPRQQLDTQAATVDQLEAALKSDQAQIESAKLNLTYSRITSPTTGRVGLRQVDAGNIVHATDTNGLVVITQLQPIVVLFTIPADALPQVQRQMKGRALPVDAYDRDLKKKLAEGALLAIDNQIDPTTGTVRLKAQFPNEDEALFPNQFVNARLLVDTLHQVVTVPTAALQKSPQSTYVYVIKPDRTVESRNVAVQLTSGDETSLKEGLKAGESVVIDGVDKLRPGMKVDPSTPDAAGTAGAAGGGHAGGEKAHP